MNVVYDKPALNFTCPKCGCKIAATKWDEIDLDDTTYEIFAVPTSNVNIDQIATISKLTGLNFIESKKIILNGGKILEGCATEILEKKKILENNNVHISICPYFKY